MKQEEAIKRIGEQIGKSNIMNYDLTTNLLNKFQEELAKLKKEGKFDNKTYYKVWSLDAIPQTGKKNYPMRVVPYGRHKFLAEVIQPALNKSKHRFINSYTFAQEAKACEIYQDELQVSYDVVNLNPSVPVEKAIKFQ